LDQYSIFLTEFHRYESSNITVDCRPKKIRSIRFNKGHKDIADKASIPLNMYLKSLAILQKASLSLKMSFKSHVICTKTSLFETKASTSLNIHLKSLKFFKKSHNNEKKFHLSGNN
jgi:hypothetical protein